MAMGRPIPTSKFVKVSKANRGTVNDLFMSIVLGSLRRYAADDPVFQSGAMDKFFQVGVANYRPTDAKGFAEELSQFATNGQNANKLDLVPFEVDMHHTDVLGIQKGMSNCQLINQYVYERTEYHIIIHSVSVHIISLSIANVQHFTRSNMVPNVFKIVKHWMQRARFVVEDP